MKRFRRTCRLLGVVALTIWSAHAMGCVSAALAGSLGNITEQMTAGDGSTVIQLRGRNAADDWVNLVQRLKLLGQLPPSRAVRPGPGQGLCQVYLEQLNLPGCSESVLRLAKSFNPGVGDTFTAATNINLPDLPLEPTSWQITLDGDILDDAIKIKDFDARWSAAILDRKTSGSRVRYTLRA